MRRAPRTGSSVPPFPPAAIAPAASHVGGCDLASVFVPNTCNNHLISIAVYLKLLNFQADFLDFQDGKGKDPHQHCGYRPRGLW